MSREYEHWRFLRHLDPYIQFKEDNILVEAALKEYPSVEGRLRLAETFYNSYELFLIQNSLNASYCCVKERGDDSAVWDPALPRARFEKAYEAFVEVYRAILRGEYREENPTTLRAYTLLAREFLRKWRCEDDDFRFTHDAAWIRALIDQELIKKTIEGYRDLQGLMRGTDITLIERDPPVDESDIKKYILTGLGFALTILAEDEATRHESAA